MILKYVKKFKSKLKRVQKKFNYFNDFLIESFKNLNNLSIIFLPGIKAY